MKLEKELEKSVLKSAVPRAAMKIAWELEKANKLKAIELFLLSRAMSKASRDEIAKKIKEIIDEE